MSEREIRCATEEEQAALAGRLARAVGNRPAQVQLRGELGTGKTTFVRGFLRGLGYEGPVRSPTYTLIEPYEVGPIPLYHLDLYRLAEPEELEFLGLREILAEPALVMVEWPERGAGWLPEPDLVIAFQHDDPGRRLRFSARTSAGMAWLKAAEPT